MPVEMESSQNSQNNDDYFEIAVEGRSTEFASKIESESEEEEEDGEVMDVVASNLNRNAQCDSRATTERGSIRNSADDVVSLAANKAGKNGIDPEEEAFFRRFKDFMTQQGWMSKESEHKEMDGPTGNKHDSLERQRPVKQRKGKGRKGMEINNSVVDSNSEITIYNPAIPIAQINSSEGKRASSSSEEENMENDFVNSSDESQDTGDINRFMANMQRMNVSFAEGHDRQEEEATKEKTKISTRYADDGKTPHCSRNRDHAERRQGERAETAEEKAERVIRDTEKSKARIFEVSGRQNFLYRNPEYDPHRYFQASMIDDRYVAIGARA